MAKNTPKKTAQSTAAPTMSELLRATPGAAFNLSALDPRATPGIAGGKKEAQEAQADLAVRLADLQERLYAEGKKGGSRSLLLVLQGLDTAGKGGTATHVLGQVDPQGVSFAAFGVPTDEERAHDFLWRFDNHLPQPGYIGVFDRSHYEDVLVVRVHSLVPRSVWSRRYARINRWEQKLSDKGTRVVKVMLHISAEESRQRLEDRLDDSTRHWKFKPHDIDERAYWGDYATAYDEAIRRCGTVTAPWYVVPADRKWFRNYAVTRLLVEQLEAMDPQWPTADFDVQEQTARLAASS